MPYSISDDDLPEAVKRLPESKKKTWIAAFNAAFEQYNGDESKAFATAWAAIKKAFDEEDLEKVDSIMVYCMQCKKKTPMLDAKKTTVDGRPAMTGKCEKGHTMTMFMSGDGMEKAGRRHSKMDMDTFDEIMGAMNKVVSMMRELRGGEDNEDGGEEQEEGEEDAEKRSVDPNVGGGVNRDELRDSDFVFSDTRTFPIVTVGDIQDAVSSWGRYRGEHSFEEFKRRLTALCQRKGFADALPDKWENEDGGVKKTWVSEIIKADSDRQICYGVVLKPAPFVDAQGDILTEEEIEKAAHKYMEDYRRYDLQHEENVGKQKAIPVESHIVHQDEVWEVGKVRKIVPKGSWVLATHVKDTEIWKGIKKGKVNAYSIVGTGFRREVEAE